MAGQWRWLSSKAVPPLLYLLLQTFILSLACWPKVRRRFFFSTLKGAKREAPISMATSGCRRLLLFQLQNDNNNNNYPQISPPSCRSLFNEHFSGLMPGGVRSLCPSACVLIFLSFSPALFLLNAARLAWPTNCSSTQLARTPPSPPSLRRPKLTLKLSGR